MPRGMPAPSFTLLTAISIIPRRAARHHGGMNRKTTPPTALAALSVEIGADGVPTEFRLLPLGRFKATDGSGRPADAPQGWLLDAAQAASLAAWPRTSRRVIDYEHQTLKSAENGKPAPASGWIGRLEARADGLWAVDVEWTPAAAAMIAGREYRYVSPVFRYRAGDGAVLALDHAALTNNPGLDGLTDLARLSALFPDHHHEEQTPMKTLLAALGLKEDASEAEAVAGVAALQATASASETQIAALKAAAPDPALYVPMAQYAEMQSQVAALSTKIETGERDLLVETALSDGRILPAQEAYWRAQPLSALSAYLAVAQPVAALSGMQSKNQKTGAGSGSIAALTAEQQSLCAQMRIDPADYLASLSAA